jgi:hypothetical protein
MEDRPTRSLPLAVDFGTNLAAETCEISNRAIPRPRTREKADNPSFDRLVRVLRERDRGWRLATEGTPARLYRTLAACKADRSKRGK